MNENDKDKALEEAEKLLRFFLDCDRVEEDEYGHFISSEEKLSYAMERAHDWIKRYCMEEK